jgi:hypothetical protein
MAKRAMNDSEALALFKEFERQPAQLTSDDVDHIEQRFRTEAYSSVYRRVGLIMLAKSGRELVEIAERPGDGAAALADAIAGIEGAAKVFRAIADNLQTAALRVELALCACEDSPALIAKARHEHADEEAQVAAARADATFQSFVRGLSKPPPRRRGGAALEKPKKPRRGARS